MRRSLVLASILLIAGCVTPPAEEPEPEETAPSRLTYGDCDEVLGAFPVAQDAVAVPEGFSPAPFLGQGNGAIFVVGWECASASLDGNASTEEPFVEGFAGFSVSPPGEMELEGAFAHALLMGLTTGSPAGVAAYEAWGIPATEGELDFRWDAAPVGGSGILAGPLGPLDVDMRVSAGGPSTPEEGSVVRFFVVEGGEVVAAYDIAWTDAEGFTGQAVSQAPLPGAPPATTGLGFFYTSEEPERYVMTPYPLPNGTAPPAEPAAP